MERDRQRERIWKIARLIRGKSIINNNNDIYIEREKNDLPRHFENENRMENLKGKREKSVSVFSCSRGCLWDESYLVARTVKDEAA